MLKHLVAVAGLLSAAAFAAPRPVANPHAEAMIAAASSGQPARAVTEADLVIAEFEARFNKADTLYLCGETQAETILNMTLATTTGKSAVAVPGEWCSAHFVKGFALIDLGQPDRAEPELRQATEMAPYNAHYLNEYAELIKSRRQWQQSYDLFSHAAEIADVYPAGGRKEVKARALRGMGFAKIELGDLDGAERLFKQSLVLQPNYPAALSELRYIAAQRAKPR